MFAYQTLSDLSSRGLRAVALKGGVIIWFASPQGGSCLAEKKIWQCKLLSVLGKYSKSGEQEQLGANCLPPEYSPAMTDYTI